MAILSDLLSASAGSFVKDVAGAIRQYVTTDADRIKLETVIEKQAQDFVISAAKVSEDYEAQLTDRQKNDMSSDSWLSKNVRPLALIYLLLLFTVIALTDGNVHLAIATFTIKAEYIAAFRSLLEYAAMFYFGGRTLEKAAAMITTGFGKK